MSTLLALFTKEVGAPLARALFDKLSQQTSRAKIGRVESLIKAGATVLDALRSVLGTSELAAVLRSAAPSPNSWTYEAGTKAYMRLSIDKLNADRAATALRDELNLNLDRVAAGDADAKQMDRYVRGVMAVWLGRIEQRFATKQPRIRAELDAIRKRFRTSESPWAKLLRVTGVAGFLAGVLCLVKAAMLMLCFGVGLFAMIKAFLFGVPFGVIAGLTMVGLLLMVLGGGLFKRPRGEQVINEAVESGYALLDAVRVRFGA